MDNIITQPDRFVKPKFETALQVCCGSEILEQTDERFCKWSAKKRQNMAVSDKMIDAGFRKRGYLMKECGTFLQYKFCPDCGKSFISSANLCRDRLCPTCAWRLSLKRFAEMCQVVNSLNECDLGAVGFLTLTVRNCRPENLGYTIRKMAEDWNRMISGRKIKYLVSGWARSLEITYNEKNNTFHPHFHIIVLLDDFIGEGETNVFFRKAWNRACRLDYEPITDFRMIDARTESTATDNNKIYDAICETFKYSVKDKELENMPVQTFREFVQAVSGVRFVSYGGIIKQARKDLNLKETETDEENEIELSRDKCTCGAELLQMVCEWSFTESQYKRLSL